MSAPADPANTEAIIAAAIPTVLMNYQFSPVGGFIADQVWIR